MSVVFTTGQVLNRGDLDVFITNTSGNPSNVFQITFALYFVDPASQQEVLIGSANRIPVNPSVGEFYAAIQIPSSATPGDYRVRWLFKETSTSQLQGVVQEFGIVSVTSQTTSNPHSPCVTDLIKKMRILTRDNCLSGSTEIEVYADGTEISVTMEELYEIIGPVSPKLEF